MHYNSQYKVIFVDGSRKHDSAILAAGVLFCVADDSHIGQEQLDASQHSPRAAPGARLR